MKLLARVVVMMVVLYMGMCMDVAMTMTMRPNRDKSGSIGHHEDVLQRLDRSHHHDHLYNHGHHHDHGHGGNHDRDHDQRGDADADQGAHEQ